MTYESEPLEFVIRHFFHNKTCDYNKCDSHFNKSFCEGYISSRTNRIFWPLLVHRMSNSKLLLSESANVKLQLRSVQDKKIVHNDVISCTSRSKASCLVRRWSRTTRCFTSSELKSKSTNQISAWVKNQWHFKSAKTFWKRVYSSMKTAWHLWVVLLTENVIAAVQWLQIVSLRKKIPWMSSFSEALSAFSCSKEHVCRSLRLRIFLLMFMLLWVAS